VPRRRLSRSGARARRSGRGAEQLGAARRREAEDGARDADVAVARERVGVGKHPEDRDLERGRVTALLRHELAEGGQAPGDVVAAVDRHPAVAEARRAARAARETTAHVDGRMRLLHGLRPGVDRREVDVLTVVLGLALGPDRLHRLDALAQEQETAREVSRAVVRHLLRVPAGAHAEEEAAVRDAVERGDVLGGLDRVALHDEADPGRDTQARRHRGGGGERHEGLVGVVVHLRELGAAGPRRAALDGDVRVLGDPERLEAARLELTREVGGLDRGVGEEDRGAVVQGALPPGACWRAAFGRG